MSYFDRYTPEYHDHQRDHLKHESRPGDRGFQAPERDEPPARLIPPISHALETAVQVKGLKNIRDAEAAVERYAQTAASAVRLDQRCSVSKLVGYCEGLANSGLLGEELELKLRTVIAETLVAFGMPARGSL